MWPLQECEAVVVVRVCLFVCVFVFVVVVVIYAIAMVYVVFHVKGLVSFCGVVVFIFDVTHR
eukprot:NODE_5699_length_493_cov_85.328829_g4261_i0.p3 GENE.NODE_5699_length_493_cov_85.328829_g4261_i0~~NODE_5699_length_493_cov_85.328829_g4261_i0.p3  ORF type:complete len:62 (+),score=1.45 NODE_5699_length_493_cov_85.328829_g4261_i0:139-324(+)